MPQAAVWPYLMLVFFIAVLKNLLPSKKDTAKHIVFHHAFFMEK